MYQYSQAEILQAAIVDNGWGSDPTITPLGIWPVYKAGEPPSPDSVVTIYSTQGRVDARVQFGQIAERYGIQVRVRSPDFYTGRSYLEGLKVNLSTNLYRYIVSLGSGTSTNQYLIYDCNNFGPIVELGKEASHSRRNIFTMNCMISYNDITIPLWPLPIN